MRSSLTGERLQELMRELARCAPGGRSYRVFILGGGTAVLQGWRASTIDADLHSDQEEVFRDIQGIKKRLGLNVEFARPEHFVPSLAGSKDRHVFIRKIKRVNFFHYDPYAQLLSKVVRGLARDVQDAASFLSSGMVDAKRFRSLVRAVPGTEYARYPALTRSAVTEAVDAFLSRPGD